MLSNFHRVPVAPLLRYCLRNQSERSKRRFFQCWTFILTFIAYMIYHICRRPFPVVKAVLSKNCTTTTTTTLATTTTTLATGTNDDNATTCHSWPPFQGSGHDTHLFGYLDFTYQISYSVFIFVNGYIAERVDLRIFLTFGMLLAATSVSLFGFIRIFEVHNVGVLFMVMMVMGMASSTGLPVVTEVMGNWLSVKNSGLVFGIWTVNNFVGNILGNLLAGSVLDVDWSLAFFLPGVVMVVGAIVVFLMLVPHPSIVGVRIHNNDKCDSYNDTLLTQNTTTVKNVSNDDDNDNLSDDTGIKCWSAFRLNSVVEFSVAVFFVKLVVYSFFFWLPFIFSKVVGDATQAAYDASLFEIGCGVGGILTGLLYDFVDAPATICIVSLVSSAPTLFLLFDVAGSVNIVLFLTFLSGIFVSGPMVLIISSFAQKTANKLTSNLRSIAMLTAIFDGFGSFGASVGPLMTGFLEGGSDSVQNFGYMMFGASLVGALVLSRQSYIELKRLTSQRAGLGETGSGEREMLLGPDEDGTKDGEGDQVAMD